MKHGNLYHLGTGKGSCDRDNAHARVSQFGGKVAKWQETHCGQELPTSRALKPYQEVIPGPMCSEYTHW